MQKYHDMILHATEAGNTGSCQRLCAGFAEPFSLLVEGACHRAAAAAALAKVIMDPAPRDRPVSVAFLKHVVSVCARAFKKLHQPKVVRAAVDLVIRASMVPGADSGAIANLRDILDSAPAKEAVRRFSYGQLGRLARYVDCAEYVATAEGDSELSLRVAMARIQLGRLMTASYAHSRNARAAAEGRALSDGGWQALMTRYHSCLTPEAGADSVREAVGILQALMPVGATDMVLAVKATLATSDAPPSDAAWMSSAVDVACAPAALADVEAAAASMGHALVAEVIDARPDLCALEREFMLSRMRHAAAASVPSSEAAARGGASAGSFVEEECVVCMERSSNVLLTRCGHQVMGPPPVAVRRGHVPHVPRVR